MILKNLNPNIDINKIEENITNKTKALVVVHYAGWSCNMEKVKLLCEKHNIYLLEDVAQAINSYYDGKPLGSFGILSAFSFHSTKNINCGEGGMLVVNDNNLISKSHIVCDKGTNRYDFLNNKINKYEWIDRGSSYPISEINAAYLYGQLLGIDEIINKRKILWMIYKENLIFINNKNIGYLCEEVENCTGNYHIFYIIFKNKDILQKLQKYLKNNKIQSFTHYVSLHKSKFYIKNYEEVILPNSEKFTTNLLRLPIHNNLSYNECMLVCNKIKSFLDINIIHKKYSELNEQNIKDIIELKSQFWNYNYESQYNWLNNNIKKNDIVVMIYNNEELIGNLIILKRSCNIIDGVIIHNNFRGYGFGGKILEYANNIIKENGFLLCEHKNIYFYKKYGWNINNDITIINKEYSDNLSKMIFNNLSSNVNYN